MSEAPQKPMAPGAGPPLPATARPAGSWWPTCLIGCLAGFALLVVLCAGGIWYAAYNSRDIVSNAARNALTTAIEDSELNPEDKRKIVAQVDRVTERFRRGEISMQQVGRIMEELAQSPLMALLLVYAAEEKYVAPSGLTDEEKAEARLTLQRVARGTYEHKISQQEVERLLDRISVKQGDQRTFKETVSDEELRALLKDARALADEKQIPEEPFEVDIGEEFKQAVDRALAERVAGG